MVKILHTREISFEKSSQTLHSRNLRCCCRPLLQIDLGAIFLSAVYTQPFQTCLWDMLAGTGHGWAVKTSLGLFLFLSFLYGFMTQTMTQSLSATPCGFRTAAKAFKLSLQNIFLEMTQIWPEKPPRGVRWNGSLDSGQFNNWTNYKHNK